MLSKFRAAGLLWVTLFALAALSVLLLLGNWQMSRKAWKDGLIAAIVASRSESPRPVREVIASLTKREYVRVRVSGRYDHQRERHLFAPDPRLGPGFHVYTPLLLDGGGRVLINRGFVPEPLKDPSKRVAGQVQGDVEVVGVVRNTEVMGLARLPHDPVKNIWYWRNVPGMLGVPPSSYVGMSADFSIDAEAEPANPGGWPRGGTTNLNLPNKHLEYAVTWYGLALTLIGVYGAFAWGRLRGRS